jgi:predicted PurR-regulated permease PerM
MYLSQPALIGGRHQAAVSWVLIGMIDDVETIGLLGSFVGPAVMAALVLIWREWAADDSVEMPPT